MIQARGRRAALPEKDAAPIKGQLRRPKCPRPC